MRAAFVTLALCAFPPEVSAFSAPISSWRAQSRRGEKWCARRGQDHHHHHPRTATSLQATINGNTWRSAIVKATADNQPDALEAVKNICASTPCRPPDAGRGEQGLAFLFVSQKCSDKFDDMVRVAHRTLGDDTTLLSIVGGGVVGGSVESDDPSVPAVSLLCGLLPSTAGVEVFRFGADEKPPPPPSSEAWKAIGRGQDVPSYVLFADGFAPIQQVLDGLDASGRNSGAVVAGGLSCPTFGEDSPTVGINGKAYPRGTAVGVGFSGTVGLQTVVAQGCRPVGPAFSVTEGAENVVEELEDRPAVEALATVTDGLNDEDKSLVESGGLLCGLAAQDGPGREVDYLVRQIYGFRVPGFMIGSPVRTGDLLRFHVRDRGAALDDIRNMIGKAKTERSFAGPLRAGVPLAALQVSCVARGKVLFGSPNVDLTNVGELVGRREDSQPVVGGFFANGEIGPVGVAGVGLGPGKQTHIHAFTTIAATICDFSSLESSDSGRGGEAVDDSAWG